MEIASCTQKKKPNDYSTYCISEVDFEKILEKGCIDSRDRALILLMGRLALRISEVANLKVRDIDFDRGVIHLSWYKGSKSKNSIKPKKM